MTTTFSASKEAKLIEAKRGFHVAVFENELLALIIQQSINGGQVSTDPRLSVNSQPALTPDRQGERLYIKGGVQMGFKRSFPEGWLRVWRYVDLFTYLPGTMQYEPTPVVAEQVGPVGGERTAELFDYWRGAVAEVLKPFRPGELGINQSTGEIDLRENIPEGLLPVLLPAGS